MFVQNLYIRFCSDGAFPDVYAASVIDNDATTYHHLRGWLKTRVLIAVWLFPLLFSVENVAPVV